MEYSISSGSLCTQSCGCLILGFFEDQQLPPVTAEIDASLEGFILKVLEREELIGKLSDTLLLNHIPDASADRILLVGLGMKKALRPKDFRKALGSAINVLKKSAAKEILSALTDIEVEDRDIVWKARETVEIFETGLYVFSQLKTGKKDEPEPTKVELHVSDTGTTKQAENGLRRGQAIANGIKLCKDMANLPGNLCTPTYLAEQSLELAQRYSQISVKILNEPEMQELGMGALLSVSRGSRQPAKLIVIEYSGNKADSQPTVLVGKGLTFDAGGISLKPAAAMDEMKYDMCGGASVIGTLSAAVEMELPINVIGIIPSSENLPDGEANKPGDIVTSMSGKTIEILNTDAEGRLILCDALTYAKRFNPETVIDIATLTGACVMALGKHPSGLMGNDETLCDSLVAAGEISCDAVWRLPLWEEYQDQLKTNFADMANVGGRDAGAITAGCFLARYCEDYKWAHLDIAGTAWKSGEAKGATGRPVPLLSQYLIDRASRH